MNDLRLLDRLYPDSADEIKKKILKSAVMCFFENGIDTTNMEMIRIKADVGIGTIYYHFKNKEGLIAQLVFAAMEDLFNYRQKYLLHSTNFQESIYALVLSYVDWTSEHPHFAQMILFEKFEVHTSEHGHELIERKRAYRSQIAGWFQLPENHFNFDGIPYDLVSSMIHGIAEHYCKYWLLGRIRHPPHFYRQEIAKATWLAISTYNQPKTDQVIS